MNRRSFLAAPLVALIPAGAVAAGGEPLAVALEGKASRFLDGLDDPRYSALLAMGLGLLAHAPSRDMKKL